MSEQIRENVRELEPHIFNQEEEDTEGVDSITVIIKKLQGKIDYLERKINFILDENRNTI